MKITLDVGAVMPTYAHEYDAGLDLYAKKDGQKVMIPPVSGYEVFDTGVHMAIPQHFCGLVKTRSSMLMKGLKTDGLVDSDYTGSIRVILFNHGDRPYCVEPGDKIAQVVISPCLRPPLELTDTLEATDRGDNGFGSSGR
jgi:dUTP pyrophosphatase